jgi:hypothetical protein
MVFKKILLLVVIFIMILSCNKKEVSKPKNLIPKDKMIDLLFDMHLANKSRNIKNNLGDKKPNYFPLIYKKYNIDSTQFKESHTYYMTNLPEYIEIYKKMDDSIMSLLKKEEKLLKEKDSLKNLTQKKKLKDINLKELELNEEVIKRIKKETKKKKNNIIF